MTRKPHFPSLYAMIYPMLRDVAMENGYCLCIHGSLARDLDVVAIPWTDEAIEPLELAKKFAKAIKCFEPLPEDAVERPHGRLCYPIQLIGPGGYVDLSIMPRSKQ